MYAFVCGAHGGNRRFERLLPPFSFMRVLVRSSCVSRMSRFRCISRRLPASSRSYAGCGGRTRRSAASAVRQHGNPEASRFFRKSRSKKIFIRAVTYPYPIASVRTRSIGLYMLPNPNNSLILFCKRRLSRHNRRWRFRARRVRCGSFCAELRALLFLWRTPSKGAKDFPIAQICFR